MRNGKDRSTVLLFIWKLRNYTEIISSTETSSHWVDLGGEQRKASPPSRGDAAAGYGTPRGGTFKPL